MPYFRATFTSKAGCEWDDYLIEAPSKADAQWYAEHRIDGSYGETDFVKVKTKRISFHEAKGMVDANAVTWADNPKLYE